MIHAYSETYLDDAMQNLGEMLDYAVNSCYLDMDDFFEMFIVGGIASQFENGVPGNCFRKIRNGIGLGSIE